MIIVKFYGYYREKLGLERVEVEEARTLSEVLEKLRVFLGEKSGILFEGNELKKNILLAVNNTLVKLEDIHSEKILDGDVVSIMPLPSGG